MKQSDNDNTDTWQTLSAATEKLLEKQRPDDESESEQNPGRPERADRKAKRGEISVIGIDRYRR